MIESTYIKLLPDHWEKKAMAIMILNLRRLPGVLTNVNHPTFSASLSRAMAVRISSNSYSTSGWLLRRYFSCLACAMYSEGSTCRHCRDSTPESYELLPPYAINKSGSCSDVETWDPTCPLRITNEVTLGPSR